MPRAFALLAALVLLAGCYTVPGARMQQSATPAEKRALIGEYIAQHAADQDWIVITMLNDGEIGGTEHVLGAPELGERELCGDVRATRHPGEDDLSFSGRWQDHATAHRHCFEYIVVDAVRDERNTAADGANAGMAGALLLLTAPITLPLWLIGSGPPGQ